MLDNQLSARFPVISKITAVNGQLSMPDKPAVFGERIIYYEQEKCNFFVILFFLYIYFHSINIILEN